MKRSIIIILTVAVYVLTIIAMAIAIGKAARIWI